jgi:predicted aspartyl protease
MKKPYRDNMPLMKLKVKGPISQRDYNAYLDTGAGKTLIPEKDAISLGLPYIGDTEVITASGKDAVRVYYASIEFLGEQIMMFILGRDLPEEALIESVVGRDLLDKYKVCFDGVRKEVTVEEVKL